MEKQARKHVDSLVRDATAVGQLRAEAAELGELIKSARLLRSGDPEKWKLLPPEVISHLLMIVIRWAGEEGRDCQVPAPPAVRRVSSLLGYIPLRLSQVLLWALNGLLTGEERKAITSSR